ncbi:MAG: hypothetical protein HC808_04620 [Candidatus Competibacteraceae bacterium]|nr:hypothetical protein [Candidatus Competibacteraceae bacterium]
MRRKVLWILSVVSVLAAVAVLVGAYLFMDIFASESTMKFDKTVWMSAWQTPGVASNKSDERNQYPRKAMLNDLLEGPLLKPGTSKSTVIELLGQGKESHDGKVLSYLIGPSDLSIDFEHLVIEFDSDQRLTKHYQWAYDSPPPYPYDDG